MGIVKEAIIIEDRLKEVINFIPNFEVGGVSLKTVFGAGDSKELNLFLKSKETDDNKPYPLIWLLYPTIEEHRKTETIVDNMQLILAVDTDSYMLNAERLEVSYKTILFPLYDLLILVMTKSNTINLKRDTKVTKFPNFSGDSQAKEHFTTERWDALKVVMNCRINNVCLKDIKL